MAGGDAFGEASDPEANGERDGAGDAEELPDDEADVIGEVAASRSPSVVIAIAALARAKRGTMT